jgi:hypothetical protein
MKTMRHAISFYIVELEGVRQNLPEVIRMTRNLFTSPLASSFLVNYYLLHLFTNLSDFFY